MTTPHWTDALAKMRACGEAMEWARTQPDLATAWAQCQRGDWMLWLAGLCGAERNAFVLAACDCAEVAWDYVEPSLAAILAVHVTREWCEGRADIDTVRAAAYAAYSASAYSAAASAAYAYSAAASAASAAYAAASAASAASAARKEAGSICADIVRSHFPTPPRLP